MVIIIIIIIIIVYFWRKRVLDKWLPLITSAVPALPHGAEASGNLPWRLHPILPRGVTSRVGTMQGRQMEDLGAARETETGVSKTVCWLERQNGKRDIIEQARCQNGKAAKRQKR